MRRFVFFSLLYTISCSQNNFKIDEKINLMIKDQLQARGIKDDSVLEAMRSVKRHKFVPEKYLEHAYSDGPLPIGYGQTISQPYIVAFMTEQLEVSEQNKVLEIGTGSGYQAGVLSKLSQHVFSIEIVPKLAEKATNILNELGYNNITVRCGDGYKGWPEEAPFERIMVTAAPEEIPSALLDQLAPNGIMILPVGKQFSVQYLWVITKDEEGKIHKEKILPVRFVPMVKG